MAVMFGNGELGSETQYTHSILQNLTYGTTAVPTQLVLNGKVVAGASCQVYEVGSTSATTTLSTDKAYIAKWSYTSATPKVVTITKDSFPGTYYIVGDTYARSETTGEDEFFQFIIPKAKMQAENTITMEAEGDPSTFNMSLTVLRPASGEMMKLVQYEL